MLSRSFAAALGLMSTTLVSQVNGQLKSDCDPTKDTCDPDPAFGTEHTWNFNTSDTTDNWHTTAGSVEYSADKGATFTVAKQGDSPTLISDFYFFWGRTEVWLKAAPGQGIVSSIVWMSDDLDEVDWEFLGTKGENASSNYFGKGRQDWRNAGYHPIEGGAQGDYHNYTSTWTKDKLEWWLDGELVRTLLPDQANSTQNYPQTPMRLSLGIWAGGDPTLPQGTRDWAGGPTDYDAGPYTMYVKSAAVEDYSTGKEYIYGDKSGSWQSIQITEGNSTAVDNLNRVPDKTTAEKWAELPASTRNGVYGAAGAVGGLAFAGLLAYYFIQRRRGAREAEMERMELDRMHRESKMPQGFDYSAVDLSAPRSPAVPSHFYNGGGGHYDSPPGSSAGLPEKGWDPTSAPGPSLQTDGSMMPSHLRSPSPASPASPVARNFSRGPM